MYKTLKKTYEGIKLWFQNQMLQFLVWITYLEFKSRNDPASSLSVADEVKGFCFATDRKFSSAVR